MERGGEKVVMEDGDEDEEVLSLEATERMSKVEMSGEREGEAQVWRPDNVMEIVTLCVCECLYVLPLTLETEP